MGAKPTISQKVLAMAVNQTKLDIHVLYCGGCGYLSNYEFASEVIRTVYPNATIVGEAHDGYSGVFDVTMTKKDGSKEKVYQRKYGGFFSTGEGSFGDEKTQLYIIEKIQNQVQ